MGDKSLDKALDIKIKGNEFGTKSAHLFTFGNIARGTTDPEIDSVTWIKLGNNMAPRTCKH